MIKKLMTLVFFMMTPAMSAAPSRLDFQTQIETSCDLRLIPKILGEASVYQVQELPPETRRSHWSDRPAGAEIDTIVVMFSSSPQGYGTIRTFTDGVGDSRVSVHYLITQTQDCRTERDGEFHIDGGNIIQIVPDEKCAWACRGLNNTGISVMFDHYGEGQEIQLEHMSVFRKLFDHLKTVYHFKNIVVNPKEIPVGRSSLEEIGRITHSS